MALPILTITKNWFTGTTVQETNWDRIRTPLLDWAARINLAFQQVTLDAFGSYSINNTGAPILSVSLQDQITALVGGGAPVLGTSNATWTVRLGSAGNAILSSAGLTGARTFTFPDATDVVAGISAVQTLSGKTLTTPTIASFVNAAHDHQSAAGGGALATAAITSGTFADARIAASNVTQHQSSLSLAASQIASGTFADARIASSNVTQHQAALAINSSQITFSEILLPDIDPPTAGYANRNSLVLGKGRVSFGGTLIGGYNITTSRISTGIYYVNIVSGTVDPTTIAVASNTNSSSAYGVDVYPGVSSDFEVHTFDRSTGLNADTEFAIIIC
jgi:hypothetical protein